MKKVSLWDIVTNTIESLSENAVKNIALVNYNDGLSTVQRAILKSLYILSNKGSKPVKSDELTGYVNANNYHIRNRSIYKSTMQMCSSVFPLILCNEQDDMKSEFHVKKKSNGTIRSSDYISFRLSPLGIEVVEKSFISPETVNPLTSKSELEFYTGMIPNMLFNTHLGIAWGLNSAQLPLNPKEVIRCMRAMVFQPNFDLDTDTILSYIKGVDLYKNHFILTTKDNMRNLIDHGKGYFAVYCPVDYSNHVLRIKEVPNKSSFQAIENTLVRLMTNTNKFKDTNNTNPPTMEDSYVRTMLQNFSISDIKKVDSDYLELLIKPANSEITFNDILKELYMKTKLCDTKNVCYKVLKDKDFHGNEYNKPLELVSLRECLQMHLTMGYENRIVEVDKLIAELEETKAYNALLEKMTRPEVREWFKPIIDHVNRKEECYQLANDIGSPTFIKGLVIRNRPFSEDGLTKEEVEIIFRRKKNDVIANIDNRENILNELRLYEDNLATLLSYKEHENILKYLDSCLAKMLTYARDRSSTIVYTNPSDDLDGNVALANEYNITNELVQQEQPVFDNVVYNYNIVITESSNVFINRDLNKVLSNQLNGRVLFSVYATSNDVINIVTSNTIYSVSVFGLTEEFLSKLCMSSEIKYIYINNDIKIDDEYIVITEDAGIRKLSGDYIIQTKPQGNNIFCKPSDKLVQILKCTDTHFDMFLENGMKRIEVEQLSLNSNKWTQPFRKVTKPICKGAYCCSEDNAQIEYLGVDRDYVCEQVDKWLVTKSMSALPYKLNRAVGTVPTNKCFYHKGMLIDLPTVIMNYYSKPLNIKSTNEIACDITVSLTNYTSFSEFIKTCTVVNTIVSSNFLELNSSLLKEVNISEE